jgi:hypothetical protein
MDWKRLDRLKEKLQTAEEFSEVWRFFLDHFGENEDFLSLGAPTRNDALARFLEEALRTSGEKHLKRSPVRISRMLLIDLPERSFLHGPAMVNDFTAGLFYFADVRMGMIALCRKGSLWAHFSRFSLNVIIGDVPFPGNGPS